MLLLKKKTGNTVRRDCVPHGVNKNSRPSRRTCAMGNGNTRVADKVCRPVNRYFQTTLIEGRLKIPAQRQVQAAISIRNLRIRCTSGNQNVNQCLCG